METIGGEAFSAFVNFGKRIVLNGFKKVRKELMA
jgi:hypothetical protein